MKVAIPGRAMKMQEHFGSGPTHLNPLLKHSKIPFNNIQIKPHIDYININNATQSSHPKEEQNTLINKEWKKTAKHYKKELKSKGNIRPSTAVRQHVKKISEDFTLTQTKYENSVNTTSTTTTTTVTTTITKSPEKKDKSPIKSASSNSSSSSMNQKIPQSKFPKNVLSKITCSKCESISKASRKNILSPSNLPPANGANKNMVQKNSNTKCTNIRNKNTLNSQSSNSRCLQELSPQKKLVGSVNDVSPRPRLRHSSARCGGGTGGGAFDFCLAPTSPGPPRSPGRKMSSALSGISPRSQQVCSEQIRRVKLFTERAILEGRVFSIFGYFPAVKDALRRRGWVEKVQHTVPYINPHPNNCVCPHVGYQLSFMSPLSAPTTNPPLSHLHPLHKTSGSASKGNEEEIKEEHNQEEEEETEVHGTTVEDEDSPTFAQTTTEESSPSDSANTDISPSSVTLLVISPSPQPSSPLESDKEQRITANLGSSTVETLVPPANPNANENENSTASDNQSDNHSTPDDSKSQESEKSSSLIGEPSDTSPDFAKNTDHFNTAILDPSEIRKGIAESITEKNAPIFKYTTATILARRSLENSKDEEDNESSQREQSNEEAESPGEQRGDCTEEEGEKKDSDEKEEEKPEPYNPYVDYDLTDSDLPLVARLLRNVEPNFLWTWTRDSISFKHLSREQLVNRFPNTPFTTKYGLCGTLQQLHWFSEAASVDTFVPRGYCIGHEDERTAFIHDYRTTACLNVLKWVTERYGTLGPQSVSDPHGEVPMKRVRQALAHVEQFIQSCCHDDLDSPPPITLRDHEWDSLITAHYKIVHMDKKIKISNQAQLQQLVSECESAVERVVPFWPQLSMDGLRNLWIVKPGAQSRGRGIFMMNHLEEILALVQSPLIYETKYVVQKYMERPLLIHNTKFDIRQWFMVTDWNPLHVWVYKECYLRFCSQQYDLTNNNEAIHLSNNAIQCKYLNGERSGELPDENMWDCHQFREYLRGVKKEHMWDEVIYPGMRDALVAAMLAAQVEMDTFKHGFELFGADFMLTEDLRPWLIEINSSPCMAPTTSVTRRMCAQCLQDVVKVVIDYKHVKTADTGLFELAYRDSEKSIPNPPYLGVNLQVVGRQIKKGPIKIEKRKPKKVKPAPRLVKPLPLITLSLEEGVSIPQKDSAPKDAVDPLARHCSILDCRRYGSNSTNSVPVSTTTSSESSSETGKGVSEKPEEKVSNTDTGGSCSSPSPGEMTKGTPGEISSKKDFGEWTNGDLSGGKGGGHFNSLPKDKDKNLNNKNALQDFRGS